MDMETAQHLLNRYGYLLIVGWTFLEGETIVILAGFIAQKGYLQLNPWLIALCAFAGSMISDQLMFSLGKHQGVSVLKRFPRLDRNTDKARRLIHRHETALALGFRFVYGIRNVTPILLGVSGLSHRRFLVLNAIGAAAWALSFTFGGYYFGHLFTGFHNQVTHAWQWTLGAAVLLLAADLLRRRLRAAAETSKAVPETVAPAAEPVPLPPARRDARGSARRPPVR